MGRMPIAAYLWPGLPMILSTGSWWGLAWAVGFAILANLLLFAVLWWPELLSYQSRNGLGLAALVFWVGSTIVTARALRQRNARREPVGKATFAEATVHYLRGEWFEAECILADLLRQNPRDVDAGLMLATLWRHTGRFSEAERQLSRLQLLDESRKWTMEIYQEKQRLDLAKTSAQSEVADAADAAHPAEAA